MSAHWSGDLRALLRAHPFSFTAPQTRPSVRGRGRYISVLLSSGTQWDRSFRYLNDFPDLTLAHWHLLLVNQLLFREAQTKGGTTLPTTLSPRSSIYSVHVIYFLSIILFRSGRRTRVIIIYFRGLVLGYYFEKSPLFTFEDMVGKKFFFCPR